MLMADQPSFALSILTDNPHLHPCSEEYLRWDFDKVLCNIFFFSKIGSKSFLLTMGSFTFVSFYFKKKPLA